jgi:hypothetical protein
MDHKTLSDLTPEQVERRARLTPKEKAAVDALVAAAKALPSTICIDVDEDGLTVQKRVTRGYARGVAHLRKKSLNF